LGVVCKHKKYERNHVTAGFHAIKAKQYDNYLMTEVPNDFIARAGLTRLSWRG